MHILAANDVPPEALDLLADELCALGFTSTIKILPVRRCLKEELPIVLWIFLPLQLFLATLVQGLAADTYSKLKILVLRVTHNQRHTEERQVVLLQDSDTGIQIVLEPDLPIEAYRQLPSFDFSTIRRGPLHYDRSLGIWRSELDEAERQDSSP